MRNPRAKGICPGVCWLGPFAALLLGAGELAAFPLIILLHVTQT